MNSNENRMLKLEENYEKSAKLVECYRYQNKELEYEISVLKHQLNELKTKNEKSTQLVGNLTSQNDQLYSENYVLKKQLTELKSKLKILSEM